MQNDSTHKSALKVNDGIEQPDTINKVFLANLKIKKSKFKNATQYLDGLLKGDITILSQAITLIESTLKEHQLIAEEIVEACLPYSGNSIRIGITGVPGVGKSTLIETLGQYITNQNNKLAVLAVDPSSRLSHGSILGDKTRMEELSINPKAFIRPSPSAGNLGGVAKKTRETIILCEAAGYNVIFIETVGVGQSETTVKDMVDFFLLLMLAGAGDELQGIKRGIMEMADMLIINKADGNNYKNALRAKAEYESALRLFPPTNSKWAPTVEVCSALTGLNINHIWNTINDYILHTKGNNFFANNRAQQQKKCLHDTLIQNIIERINNEPNLVEYIKENEELVMALKLSPYKAAKKIQTLFK